MVASRPRLITILTLILIIGSLGYMVGASILHLPSGRSFFAERRREFNVYDFIFTCLLLAVTIYLIWYFIWRWTSVSLNVATQQLKVFRPFQLYRRTYQFSNITGFYLTSRYTKLCEIKILMFLTSTGEKIYITDLETANFRNIEGVVWEQFTFIDKKTLLPLDEHQKQTYQQVTNKSFDFEQAKAIKFSLIISIIALVLIAVFDHVLIFGPASRQLPTVVRVTLFILIVYLFFELLRIGRRIQKMNVRHEI